MSQTLSSLARLTLRQLRTIASELGVPLYSRKSKEALVGEVAERQEKRGEDLKAIEQELSEYSQALIERPIWLALSKVDQLDDADLQDLMEEMAETFPYRPVYGISALGDVGLDELKNDLMQYLIDERMQAAEDPDFAEHLQSLEKRISDAGHTMIKRTIIPDDVSQIKNTLDTMSKEENIDCIITTGGTGLTGRDTTPEAVNAIASKHIDGFGELFRQVSFEKIGTSAIQSRAVAALINSTYVFCLPGSTGACKDGWDEILQYQLDIRHKPCNFVEIMPRLNEK